MFDKLFDSVKQKKNPSVLGLDTRLEYLPAGMLADFQPDDPFASAADLLERFNFGLIDALYDIIPCVKIQLAYYEMYGADGLRAACNTAQYARQKGMLVIADAKRNDIGTTAEAYAAAYLGKTTFPDGIAREAFGADMLTVSAYLGADGVQPFVEDCKRYEKGIFVLVKTSNPSSGDLQDKAVDGQPVYQRMAEYVQAWGEGTRGRYGYAAVGAVVGATYPQQGAALRERFPDIPFLLPGYGAQGAKGSDLALAFDKDGLGAVVNASRSLMCAYRKEGAPAAFDEAARKEALRMQADIVGALQAAGRASY